MEQLISRKYALEQIEYAIQEGTSGAETKTDLGHVRDFIHSLPSVDPHRRGTWVYDRWCEFRCSECGAYSKSEPYRGREPFCYNCGAEMGVV